MGGDGRVGEWRGGENLPFLNLSSGYTTLISRAGMQPSCVHNSDVSRTYLCVGDESIGGGRDEPLDLMFAEFFAVSLLANNADDGQPVHHQ